ncbi:hypothetical protein ACWEPM_11855 [Streptomyces sp. NPDC004244]|uniref:hypothetical protein n=1 Tax=Streptomyces sp. NPDC101206 TaxID=3366128 RepID=UPI00382B83DA
MSQEQVPEADPVVVVDAPGLVAEHLADVADDAVRRALQDGQTICRGQGYSVLVTAPLTVHRAMIDSAEPVSRVRRTSGAARTNQRCRP